jgi:hypothetical protein
MIAAPAGAFNRGFNMGSPVSLVLAHPVFVDQLPDTW